MLWEHGRRPCRVWLLSTGLEAVATEAGRERGGGSGHNGIIFIYLFNLFVCLFIYLREVLSANHVDKGMKEGKWGVEAGCFLSKFTRQWERRQEEINVLWHEIQSQLEASKRMTQQCWELCWIGSSVCLVTLVHMAVWFPSHGVQLPGCQARRRTVGKTPRCPTCTLLAVTEAHSLLQAPLGLVGSSWKLVILGETQSTFPGAFPIQVLWI